MKSRHPSSGQSLIAVLIAIPLVAIVLMGVLKVLETGIGGSRHVELRGEKEAIRMALLGKISCAKTFGTSPCSAAGALITVKTKSDDTLISASGTQLGEYTLRAECNSTLDGVVVKAVHLAPGSSVTSTDAEDFIADPLTKKKVFWDDAAALLFGLGVELCPFVEEEDVHKKYAGVTSASYTGNLGGWSGANAKCEADFGSGAVICSAVQLENANRAGQAGSFPSGDFWIGGMKDHWIGQHCRNWTSANGSDQGNTLDVDSSQLKMHAQNHGCNSSFPIVCCK
ncbi:MAG: hypothetical protein KDD51_11025 [Bdellovibrionales bacterium]|nr:hypothetical protein [Bdellovibrionales bacterium]